MYDIAIIGGGLVGVSFALDVITQNPKLKIVIIEQNKPDFTNNNHGYDNKIYAISPKNLKRLVSLGVCIDETRVGIINEMNVRGDNNSNIKFDSSDCNMQYLAKIIEYRNLHKAVMDKLLIKPQVEFIYTKVNSIHESNNAMTVNFSDDSQFHAKWVVASDGANSFVRKQFNFAVEQIPYYQSGVVANFHCEKSHHNTAHQWFLGDGVLAYLPLPNNNISIVWSTDQANLLLDLHPNELAARVGAACQYELGQLTQLTSPLAFPLKLNLVDKFFSGRVILIGDAAHTIHPLAGQGVNIGFGDAWELADLMAINAANLDISELNKFNALRMSEVRKMQMTCHLLHRLFHNRSTLMRLMRNFGLNLVNKLSVLKKLLINSAINY